MPFSFLLVFFSLLSAAAAAAAVPLSNRTLLTLRQARYNCSSRSSRCSFCDSYVRTVLLCVCVRIMRARHPKKNKGQVQPTLPLMFKSILAVQQRHNSSSSSSSDTAPVNLATLIVHGYKYNACVPPFRLAILLVLLVGFQVSHIPKGNLVFSYDMSYAYLY